MAERQLAIQSGRVKSFATDDKSADGSSHSYGFSYQPSAGAPSIPMGSIKFQNGPVAQAGVNGVSDAQLISVLIDHIEGFQNGPYRCNENYQAAWHLREALGWLKLRANNAQYDQGQGSTQGLGVQPQ